jgi:hypothetical protein|tara:strand:+ start:8365 stop:8907 length:543 start_codon:yes stop_codon:yes gene_type:complete
MIKRRLFILILIAAAVPFLSHCGDSGNNHSTTDRSLGRASFTHPEGWEITSETDIDPFYQFMLQTQRDDVCLISVDEPDAAEDLMDAAKEFASAAQVDVAMLSSGDSNFVRLDPVDGWESVREEFVIKVLGLGTPMRRDHYRKVLNGLEVTIMLQSEADVREGHERGLKLIRNSFKITDQ